MTVEGVLPVDDGAKAEAEEVADFDPDTGDVGEAPRGGAEDSGGRVAPDYGDVMDDDEEDEVRSRSGSHTGPPVSGLQQPPRPQALYVGGANRLQRGHLLEVLKVKDLPCFDYVEWISDDEVLLIFEDRATCRSVLASFQAGFKDVTEKETTGQPGLWRAVKGFLTFRQANIGDTAPLGFKKQHRSGRRVREFRAWAAEQPDLDLSEDDPLGKKRHLFPEDFGGEGPPTKRARTAPGGVDLLEMMATADKTILMNESPDERKPDRPLDFPRYWGSDMSGSEWEGNGGKSRGKMRNDWGDQGSWDGRGRAGSGKGGGKGWWPQDSEDSGRGSWARGRGKGAWPGKSEEEEEWGSRKGGRRDGGSAPPWMQHDSRPQRPESLDRRSDTSWGATQDNSWFDSDNRSWRSSSTGEGSYRRRAGSFGRDNPEVSSPFGFEIDEEERIRRQQRSERFRPFKFAPPKEESAAAG